jgi:uncharacterized membrane-anchored protein YjiN (DUF445 family)
MSLDYASHVFFTALQDAISSDQPPRKRLEQLCSASLDKLRGDETLREDISARISRLQQSRARVLEISESEVKALLKEAVSIYDAIAAQLYATGRTKAVTND